MQSISYAYHDALSGVRGRAEEYKILVNDANDDKLIAYIRDKKSFFIFEEGQDEDAYYLRNFLIRENPSLSEVVSPEQADMVFHLCPYIFQVKDLTRKEIYIDGDRNCIITEDDVEAVRNYEYSKLLFLYMNQGVFLASARKLRGGIA